MSALPLPDPALAQREASDPRVSAWVAASAGTGKTKVLTDRVLRLLLAGTPPGRILCLTFTKAAAAEMANRLNKTLAHWAVIPNMELSREIEALGGVPPVQAELDAARRLFALVLDTPGGMRILTIHAFCQSVLRRFPLEAGVPPQFEVMDDRAAAELLFEARQAVLTEALTGPALAEPLKVLASLVQESTFATLMEAMMGEGAALQRAVDGAGGVAAYLTGLARRIGLAPGTSSASIRAAAAADSAFDGPILRRAAKVLAASDKITDQRLGEGLGAWLEADPDSRAAWLGTHTDLFLTAKFEPRKTLGTKAVLAANPWAEPALRAEQERMLDLDRALTGAQLLEATEALTRIALACLDQYQRRKAARAILDYDDLIQATRSLLQREGVAPWVLYKLDGGLDHLLIDEAQDTNPDQWAVAEALTAEFFAGIGARDPVRTVFAVGDPKQSIFSFQGAEPEAFLRMRTSFRARAEAVESTLRPVDLTVSFRSTQAVLDLVDKVFESEEARDGVALDHLPIRHQAHRVGMSGRVELWPLEADPEDLEPDAWALPTKQRGGEPPRTRLARRIAATIADWIGKGEPLPARGRAIQAGDILVLVRRRNAFVTELLKELKRQGVAVAGADRMHLPGQLAVMDLVAIGRFLLLPDDDLTLATILRGPLFSWSEEALFALAHERAGTLWQSLRNATEEHAIEAASRLGALLGRADFTPPFELYAGILATAPWNGRWRLTARLGPEAEEAIDEFLGQCLAYERTNPPALEGFLHWLERGESEVKRDLDTAARDQVRVMTAHGAKGLQAPIVILPDTVATPAKLPALLWHDGLLLWAPRDAGRHPLAAAAKARAIERRDQEYRRLLYVALTRAEDRLLVCGWAQRATGSAASWHDLVTHGLTALEGSVTASIPAPSEHAPLPGAGRVYETAQVGVPTEARRALPPRAPASGALPDWVSRPPAPEPAPPRPLVATRTEEAEPPTRSPLATDFDRQRFQRGLLVHRLLQTLPGLDPEEAATAARRFLARPTHGLAPEEQAAIAAETLAVMHHAEFAPLFGPDSQAEVPVVGVIDGAALSGRIDRLVVTEDAVLIVDYKTNRPPPERPEAVAPIYLRQLGAYRKALRQIYRDRPVRTLLLWTDGPRLMEVDTTHCG